MKHYPSIKTIVDPNVDYWVFDKIDGSNIRAEWNQKNGFYKFGSRKILINENSTLGEAKTLVEAQGEALGRVLNDTLKAKTAVLFFEYFGPNSFAGQHSVEETHECRLIDCDIRGQIDPQAFIKAFGDAVSLPRLLRVGKVDREFLERVDDGSLPNMTFEGVVGKSQKPTRWLPPHMFKHKNRAWIQAVKDKHGESAKHYL